VFFARSCYAAPVSNQPRGEEAVLAFYPGSGFAQLPLWFR
jgi:hypothetical protein